MSKKNKTYIISVSHYMGDEPYMFDRPALSAGHLAWALMYDNDYLEDEDEYDPAMDESYILEFREQNGDGQPYLMAWDLEAHTQVL